MRQPNYYLRAAVLVSGIASLAACGTGTMTSAATSSAPVMAAKASPIAPPANSKSLMKVPAIGVQIYKCASTNGQLAWSFVAPEADLFDANGKVIGRHGAGPFWEMLDGSKVIGTVAGRENSPRPGAIPHLMITTKSTGASGAISSVTALQRVNTIGGVAPATGCSNAVDIDKIARVFYTADYVLFTS